MNEVNVPELRAEDCYPTTWTAAKVLLISLAFPPRLDAESLQAFKLHKYLSRLPNTDVHIVTAHETRSPISLLHPTAKGSEGVTRFSLFGSKLVEKAILTLMPGLASMPDMKRHALWNVKAISEALPWKPDIVVSRSYPISSALLAQAIANERNVPWIMQLSDPWAFSPLHPKGYSYTWNAAKERLALSRSSITTFTSLRTMQRYADRYPEYESKFRYFPNTYDPEEMRDNPWSRKKTMRIVYAGTLGGTRSPNSLCDAIRQLIQSVPEIERHVEVLIAGYASREVRSYLSRQPSYVKYLGAMSFSEAMNVMRSADLLVLIDNKIPEDRESFGESYEFFPSKILDYMVARRPVLTITSQSSLAANIVAEYNLGQAFLHSDLAGIAHAIGGYWRDWRNGEASTFDREASADLFDARNGAIRLRREIEEAINEY